MIKNPKRLEEYIVQSKGRKILFQPNSIDLRIDEVYVIGEGLRLSANGDRELPDYARVEADRGWFKLRSDQLYQIEFEEKVDMPLGVCGITLLRSTMFKSGASGESGLFDSGYRGGTGMTIATRKDVQIERGAPIAQMLFFESEEGSLYSGYYQNGYKFKGD